MAASTPLSPALRRALDRLARDLERIFGDRFEALVAYGHGASVAFAASIAATDLDAASALVEAWHREGLATPLMMTTAEFRRSLDSFPLEYQAIIDDHVVIAGRAPFDGTRVNTEDLRRACESQAKGHLIHLRQTWLESAGHAHGLADRVAASAAPLRALLMNVARLQGVAPDSRAALVSFASTTVGMPADLVNAVLALENDPTGAPAVVRRISAYLDATERLWAFVDAWRA